MVESLRAVTAAPSRRMGYVGASQRRKFARALVACCTSASTGALATPRRPGKVQAAAVGRAVLGCSQLYDAPLRAPLVAAVCRAAHTAALDLLAGFPCADVAQLRELGAADDADAAWRAWLPKDAAVLGPKLFSSPTTWATVGASAAHAARLVALPQWFPAGFLRSADAARLARALWALDGLLTRVLLSMQAAAAAPQDGCASAILLAAATVRDCAARLHTVAVGAGDADSGSDDEDAGSSLVVPCADVVLRWVISSASAAAAAHDCVVATSSTEDLRAAAADQYLMASASCVRALASSADARALSRAVRRVDLAGSLASWQGSLVISSSGAGSAAARDAAASAASERGRKLLLPRSLAIAPQARDAHSLLKLRASRCLPCPVLPTCRLCRT